MEAFSYQSPTLRPYQQEAVDAICNDLCTDRIHIIAFCTGGGKTHTARKIIVNLMNNYRCLVLTHNQTILRDNFAKQFVDGKYVVEYQGTQDLLKAQKARVVIGIPSGLYKQIHHLGKFDYVMIDEAHQYISKECTMFKTIQKHLGIIPTILLTASHYCFNDSKYVKHLYAREQALLDGVISDVEVQLIRTDWHPRKDSFDKNSNLKQNVTIPDVYGIEVCDEMAIRIEDGNYLKKSIIACHNTETANKVFEYFEQRYEGKVLLSHSQNDSDATAFKDFQEKDEYRILIVVNRGIIGFDCPQLECIFDLTLSKNIARIEQLLGRIIRQYDVDKIYYRIAPTVDLLNHTIVMNSVLALSIEENNREFDGSKTSLKIIFKPEDKEAILAEQAAAIQRLKQKQPVAQPMSYKEAAKKPLPKKKVVSLRTRPILKQSEYNDVFNKVAASGSDVWELEGYITLAEALGIDKKPTGWWDMYENCLEEAKKYNSFKEFHTKNHPAYHGLNLMKKVEELCQELGWEKSFPKGHWKNYENIKEAALKCSSIKDFKSKYPGAYTGLQRLKSEQQLFNEMNWENSAANIKAKGYWKRFDNCLEEAKKYKSAKDFHDNCKVGYNRAVEYKYLNQIKKDCGWS